MKKILIIWTVFAVLLVGTLTTVGFAIKKQNKEYRSLEEKIKFEAQRYYGVKPVELKAGAYISITELKNDGYEINNVINGDTCTGYVLITSQMSLIKYNPYLKCEKYTTKGYNSLYDTKSSTCTDAC